nr:Gp138 family membrane-puncturing spike protein [Hafnia alvei]
MYNFNASSQTAEVQLAIESVYIGLDSSYQLIKKDRLKGVPVQVIRGGGWSLTFPVPDGTPCIVIFQQRGIEHWVEDGSDSAGMLGSIPAHQFGQYYTHDNAVAVLGINPVTTAIQNYQGSIAEFRNADRSQRVTLNEDGKIEIVTGSSTIVISKDGDIVATSDTSAKIIAPEITLDGNTTVTGTMTCQKTLDVAKLSSLNGGISTEGGTDATVSIKGKMIITETINDIQIELHQHPYDWTDDGGNSNTMPPIPL